MDFSILIRIVDEVSADKLSDTILLHVMGEPLLYADLEKAINYIKGKGLQICLTTNGWLLTRERFAYLSQAGIDQIIISAQTPDSASFKLRGVAIDFDEYQKRIVYFIGKALKDPSSKTEITLSFLATPFRRILLPHNPMTIMNNRKEMYRYLAGWLQKTLQPDQVPSALKKIRKMGIMGWNRVKIAPQFMVETRLLGDWVQPGLMAARVKRARFGMCEGLNSHFGILWNGDLVFCCIDFDGNTAFGNVKKTRIVEALQSNEFQHAKKQFKQCRVSHPYCQRCLGDISWMKSAVRQLGSIFYYKVYRRYWNWRRAQVN